MTDQIDRDPKRERSFSDPMEGPTGASATTEAIGDPDDASEEAGVERGAGAGVLAGAAVAGPPGALVGGAAGALAGGVAEGADRDDDRNDESRGGSGSAGTGPVDPATDYVRD
ncbi:MAG TPA: hypothetical protein VH723_03865 [Candidatus Limnocylindrales bacterium]|jgi:hypothetical protein